MSKDGGPAFPVPIENDHDAIQRFNGGYGGISKLEYFAAAALQGLLAAMANPNATDPFNANMVSETAKTAFAYAAAMLAESEKRSDR